MFTVCENCEMIVPEEMTSPIKNLWERVDANNPMPAGECPDCGCLCYYHKDRPDLENKMNVCNYCKKTIEEENDLFYLKDNNNSNANPEGYITICSKCAGDTLLDAVGSSVAYSWNVAKKIIELIDSGELLK